MSQAILPNPQKTSLGYSRVCQEAYCIFHHIRTHPEWAFVAPYLTLKEDAPQRDYPLRELFNALRRLVRTGSAWLYVPNDLPPWHTVCERSQRWFAAGCFEAIVHDLRLLLREAKRRTPNPAP